MLHATSGTPRADFVVYQTNPARDNLIAGQVLPAVIKQKKKDTFLRVPSSALLRIPDTKKNRGSGANRSTLNLEEDSYKTKGYYHAVSVDDEEKAEFEEVEPAQLAANMADGIVLAALEKELADMLTTPASSLWAAAGNTGAVFGTPWDVAAATPAKDITPGLDYLTKVNGVKNNRIGLIVPQYNLAKFAEVTEIRQRLQITSRPFETDIALSDLMKYFNVGGIFPAAAVYNSAKEGAAESITRIWDEDNCFLFVMPAEGDLKGMVQPSLGRTIVWKGPNENAPEQIVNALADDSGFTGIPTSVVQFREPAATQDVIQAGVHAHMKTFGLRFGWRGNNTKT